MIPAVQKLPHALTLEQTKMIQRSLKCFEIIIEMILTIIVKNQHPNHQESHHQIKIILSIIIGKS